MFVAGKRLAQQSLRALEEFDLRMSERHGALDTGTPLNGKAAMLRAEHSEGFEERAAAIQYVIHTGLYPGKVGEGRRRGGER